MSMRVELDDLAATIESRGPAAFVCTVSDPPRTHITHTSVTHDGAVLRCEVGATSGANAQVRSDVVLLWPCDDDEAYSLIVDGAAEVDGSTLIITPTAAVWHRPAPS